jgi:hypothetical protein
MREYTVQYTDAKGKVELYSFEAENIEEAISIAQNDVDEYPNVEIYDDTDAEGSNRGVLMFKNGTQKTVHRIEDIALTKHNSGSDNLQYTADGKTFEVDGEFYVDRDHNLHHTHLFENGDEIEIAIPYENGSHKL